MLLASLTLTNFENILTIVDFTEFMFNFKFFGLALNCLSYLFTHRFDNVSSGLWKLSLIYIFGFIGAPAAVSLILSAIFDFESTMKTTMLIWYFTNPFYTFAMEIWNLCMRSDEKLEHFIITVGED